MNLKQLTYFLAVAEEGSFSRAATALHMTQPPLSLAIAQLEKELGVLLLQRHSHGVTCTDAGDYLRTGGESLLQHASRLENHLKALGRGDAGELNIASVPSFAWEYLPPLLQEFAAEAPGVSVDLSDPSPNVVLELVSSGRADLGFVATADSEALGRLVPQGVRVQRVRHMPLVAALPPRYADAPDVIDLETLMHEQWLLPRRHPKFPGLIEQVEQLWGAMGRHPDDVRIVSTLQTAIPLVAAGIGVAVMPSSVAKLGSEQIVTRPIVQPVGHLEGALVWSEIGQQKPAARRFIELALAAAERIGDDLG